ncbi:hypothetical protein LC087_10565 [Bacillus carboniphilus]|uniref:Spore coat protein n=1 Tax=Bacillus carboniphilus TaxID=86663 RepID=A0ABY9JSG5_9BACI|nr:hypothetical protein [Bacillus carboniphilus]WLR41355.1 hypothetical protein LC087_10565 [Bacillus carboniphilus]
MYEQREREKLCIRVPKVYDWVERQVDLPLISLHDLIQIGFDCDGVTGGGVTGGCDDPCAVIDTSNAQVKCFLTNSLGKPVDPNSPGSILVQEITQINGRQDVSTTLPSGKKIILQKVKVLVKGFVVVEICDAKGNVCTSDPIPFASALKHSSYAHQKEPN